MPCKTICKPTRAKKEGRTRHRPDGLVGLYHAGTDSAGKKRPRRLGKRAGPQIVTQAILSTYREHRKGRASQPPRLQSSFDVSGALQRRSLYPHVWTAPSWQGLSLRMQHWSVRPCVRPLSAVRMTAGHNALRGSGPEQHLAFDNAWG